MQPCNGEQSSTFSIDRIAMVEADEGLAMIPSCGLPACRNRKVLMSRLIHPLVNAEFCQISNRGKRLPPGAEKFTALLRSYINGSRVGLARFSRHLWYS